ncbi:MAG: hypothetical protein JWQ73_3507 [Variovorax sp.]|nr:hypothetical protein [Variovorax sp.]
MQFQAEDRTDLKLTIGQWSCTVDTRRRGHRSRQVQPAGRPADPVMIIQMLLEFGSIGFTLQGLSVRRTGVR